MSIVSENFNKKLILLLLAIVLTACTNKSSEQKKFSEKEMNWLLVKENISKNEVINTFEIINDDGNLIKSEQFTTNEDISYKFFDENNKVYYRFGPGGLISVDLKDKNIKYLIKDKDINSLRVEGNEIYYYENIGPDGENYRINICKLNNTSKCLELNYFVNDFIVKNEHVYTVNGKKYDKDSSIIHIYNKGDLIKKIPVDDSGSFYICNDDVHYLTKNGMLNVENQQYIPFVDENNIPLQLANTFNAFYNTSSNYYFISNEIGEIKMYHGELINEKFKLKEISLKFDNIIDYEFDGKEIFTFMNKNREFYFFNINTNKTGKLNIQQDNLNSSLLSIK